MFAQDTPFIYHLRSRATPSSSGWYMNGISWATIVYLLLRDSRCVEYMYFFVFNSGSGYANKSYRDLILQLKMSQRWAVTFWTWSALLW